MTRSFIKCAKKNLKNFQYELFINNYCNYYNKNKSQRAQKKKKVNTIFKTFNKGVFMANFSNFVSFFHAYFNLWSLHLLKR